MPFLLVPLLFEKVNQKRHPHVFDVVFLLTFDLIDAGKIEPMNPGEDDFKFPETFRNLTHSDLSLERCNAGLSFMML